MTAILLRQGKTLIIQHTPRTYAVRTVAAVVVLETTINIDIDINTIQNDYTIPPLPINKTTTNTTNECFFYTGILCTSATRIC